MTALTASRITELHKAHVDQLMAKGVPPCEECGTAMVTGTGFDGAPSRGIDVFAPVAADGSYTAPAADLLHLFDPSRNWLGASGPYQYLSRLAEVQGEAHKACEGRYQGGPRAELTGLFWAVAAEYSALLVRLDAGMTFHVHRPAPLAREAGRNALPLPYHCGQMPAWLRPSGFYCRECGELLTDATAVYRDARPYYRYVPGAPAHVCEVCSGREGTTEVAQFGNRLVCGQCVDEAKARGILPAE